MFNISLNHKELKNVFMEVLKDYNQNTSNKISTDEWMRSKDVREMLKISDSTLQTLRTNGTIPAYKLNTIWFYKKDEIEKILNDNKIDYYEKK